MKQNAQDTAAALAVAGGLFLAGSAHAQSVTGAPYLSNIDPSTLNTSPNATYASWNSASSSTPVTFTSQPTGLEVAAATYGSLYYVVPGPNVQTLNPLDTEATLTFTVNSPSVANINWIGVPFILGDNTGAATYGGYSTSGNPGSNPLTTVTWNGNVVTETQPLSPGQLAAVQTGTDAIYSFNLETDPASFNGPPVYDITFNSLALSPTPTPEPTSLALVALGAAGLVISRRRK
jgi:hypothetical protein